MYSCRTDLRTFLPGSSGFFADCQEYILDRIVRDSRFVQCWQGFGDFKKPLPGSCAEFASFCYHKRMSNLIALRGGEKRERSKAIGTPFRRGVSEIPGSAIVSIAPAGVPPAGSGFLSRRADGNLWPEAKGGERDVRGPRDQLRRGSFAPFCSNCR